MTNRERPPNLKGWNNCARSCDLEQDKNNLYVMEYDILILINLSLTVNVFSTKYGDENLVGLGNSALYCCYQIAVYINK